MAIERHVAIHCSAQDILKGQFSPGEGFTPGFVRSDRGDLKRVNVIGLIVQAPKKGLILIDDGTARVTVRLGNDKMEIGDTVQVIGRPREIEHERYIAAEIVKVLSDERWLELRQLQLSIRVPLKEVPPEKAPSVVIDRKKEEKEMQERSVHDRVADLIRTLDSGKGADIEQIVLETEIKNIERILQNMKERGEIFEIKPGMVKVLE